jgi:hypothetical protein
VHVHRLVSVVKMVTVLEKCTTVEQRSVVRVLWAKGFNAKDIHKESFLFMVGSVCRVRRFTSRSRNSRTFGSRI